MKMNLWTAMVIIGLFAVLFTACFAGDDDDSSDNASPDDSSDDAADDTTTDDADDVDPDDDIEAPHPYTPYCDVDAEPLAMDDPGLSADGAGPYLFVKKSMTFNDTERGREIPADIYFPSTDGTNPADDGAPFPAVISVHGFSGFAEMMQPYGERLASWGFIVVAPSLPYTSPLALSKMSHVESTKDILFILNILCYLTAQTDDTIGFFGRVDRARLGAVSHSMGGKLSVLSSLYDGALSAVVGLDPVDGAGPFDWSDDPDFPNVTPDLAPDLLIPTMYLGSEKGGTPFLGQACAPTEYNYHQFWTYSPPPSVEITVMGSDHTDFVIMPGILGLFDPCNIGSADGPTVKSLAMKYALSFLNVKLRGWDRFEDEYLGEGIEEDVNAGLVTWEAK